MTACARIDLRVVAQQVDQFRGAGAQNAGQRHAVNVAARAALGRVHVGVRVEPDQADLFAARAEVTGNAADACPPRRNDRRPARAAGVRRAGLHRRGWRALRRRRRSARGTWRAGRLPARLPSVRRGCCPSLRPRSRARRRGVCRLATRTAEGPISTPRRSCPRSSGAPMIAMWVRGISLIVPRRVLARRILTRR